MTRSYRHTSISGIAMATSEKKDKICAHRKERRKVNKMLVSPSPDFLHPKKEEISNVWCHKKDGKRWFDARKYPKEMRK